MLRFMNFTVITVTSEEHIILYEKMLRIMREAYHSVKAVYLIIIWLYQKHEKKIVKKKEYIVFVSIKKNLAGRETKTFSVFLELPK